MRRRLASPEAETMSYCEPPPWRMSVTISSEEPAYLACTWQPVCFWKGLTHCGCVDPSHATRLSRPSPGPIFVGRFEAALPPPPPPLLLSSLPPHAASTNIS